MNWLLFGLLAVAFLWWVSAVRSKGGRAPNRLNNQGLPRGYTREGHEQNDEE